MHERLDSNLCNVFHSVSVFSSLSFVCRLTTGSHLNICECHWNSITRVHIKYLSTKSERTAQYTYTHTHAAGICRNSLHSQWDSGDFRMLASYKLCIQQISKVVVWTVPFRCACKFDRLLFGATRSSAFAAMVNTFSNLFAILPRQWADIDFFLSTAIFFRSCFILFSCFFGVEKNQLKRNYLTSNKASGSNQQTISQALMMRMRRKNLTEQTNQKSGSFHRQIFAIVVLASGHDRQPHLINFECIGQRVVRCNTMRSLRIGTNDFSLFHFIAYKVPLLFRVPACSFTEPPSNLLFLTCSHCHPKTAFVRLCMTTHNYSNQKVPAILRNDCPLHWIVVRLLFYLAELIRPVIDHLQSY